MLELENIDDECDANGIAFVKIDNDEEAKEYGIDNIPTLVYFEKKIPHVYEGNTCQYWILLHCLRQHVCKIKCIRKNIWVYNCHMWLYDKSHKAVYKYNTNNQKCL